MCAEECTKAAKAQAPGQPLSLSNTSPRLLRGSKAGAHSSEWPSLPQEPAQQRRGAMGGWPWRPAAGYAMPCQHGEAEGSGSPARLPPLCGSLAADTGQTMVTAIPKPWGPPLSSRSCCSLRKYSVSAQIHFTLQFYQG